MLFYNNESVCNELRKKGWKENLAFPRTFSVTRISMALEGHDNNHVDFLLIERI
jgi:hypothetical protein